MSLIAESDFDQTIMPVGVAERISTLDILRGFALLGILLVNMAFFSQPLQTIGFPPDPSTSFLDNLVAWLVRFFAEGKFYSLFSFLFGLGFTLQFARAEARGGRFARLHLRRLLVLLLIGLIHAFLIWMGDILVTYALLGFLLLLFRRVKPRTVLIWAGVFFLIPLVLMSLLVAAIQVGRYVPEAGAGIERSFAEQETTMRAEAVEARRVYATGSYAEITAQRARDVLFIWTFSFFFAPNILAMFLIGVYFGRRGLFHNIDEHLLFFRRLLWWGLVIGLLGNFIFATISHTTLRTTPSPALLAALVAQTIGAPALCFFYVAAITLLVARQATMQKIFGYLAPVGRMALTNYLMQSIVCTLIFYAYGLGFFGRVGTAATILLAMLIYAAQILISNLWMQRFQFGPMEWLWRSLTYMQLQPMRKTGDAAV